MSKKGLNLHLLDDLIFAGLYSWYTAQLDIYHKIGFTSIQDGKVGIFDQYGTFRPVPTLEEIHAVINEKKENLELEYKQSQGFSRYMLVPIGLSSEKMYSTLVGLYRHYQRKVSLFQDDRKKTPLKITLTPTGKEKKKYNMHAFSRSLTIKEDQVYYYPKDLRQNDPALSGGVLKDTLLESQRFPGWEIHILQKDTKLRRRGTGKTISDRPELDGGLSAADCLDLISDRIENLPGKAIRDKNGKLVYRHEVGSTSEVWIVEAIMKLTEYKKVHGDIENKDDAGCLHVGTAIFYQNIYGKNINVTCSQTDIHRGRILCLGEHTEVDYSDLAPSTTVKVC